MGNSSTAPVGGTNISSNGSLGFSPGFFWPFGFSLSGFTEALSHCHVSAGAVGWFGFKIFILLTAFPANSCLMWLLLRRRAAMTASELLGVNVAAMDILYCVVLPLDIYTSLHRSSETQHAVREALFALNIFGCPLLLTCMCVERYLAVAWPVTYLRLGGRSYRLVLCGCIWTLTLAVVLLGFFARMFTMTLCLCAVISLLFLLMLLSLLGMVRVLRRSGPGDGGGTTLKRRALRNIMAVTVPSVAAYCPVVVLVPYMLVVSRQTQQLSAAHCSVINFLLLFPNLGLFIGPMFYLARIRQVSCCSRESPASRTQAE
ncbi:proteinase-activated receptor 3 [Stegastes partitus]|uniref:Proteinase-activated receptor 3 n=1 Tax=Stegastes partitus TaxID=144197 RepID=A0A9Y4KD96_9TELE|nr:PREDICTED: proteinase-activated receptor 3-like [Stegastes partitus]